MSGATRYRLLSFDLDGTLVDTAGEIAEAANRTLDEFGLPRQSGGVIAGHIGLGTRELMLGLLGGLAVGHGPLVAAIDRDAVLRRFSYHYAQTAGTACRPYAHAAEALQDLRDAGLRLACVTNKEERFSRTVLGACGLANAFDLLVGGDTLDVKKPDRRILRLAMQALGTSEATTVHVGDSRTDVEAARNAGVTAWAVTYGYNGGEPVAMAHPDRLFDDLGEVAALALLPT
jgi:phosphoglycolate phosphatase